MLDAAMLRYPLDGAAQRNPVLSENRNALAGIEAKDASSRQGVRNKQPAPIGGGVRT